MGVKSTADSPALGELRLGHAVSIQGALWFAYTCRRAIRVSGTHLERQGQVIWEQSSFLGQSPTHLTPFGLSFLFLSCEVVWVAWDREAGRGCEG